MNGKIPHLVQYQGSKRILAPQILQYMPVKFKRLIEPFAGMAAISIATAYENRSPLFIINDLNKPLIDLLCEAINKPEKIIAAYADIWKDQFTYGENHTEHFYQLRDKFNQGEKTPANLLYLLARCIKGSVRYGKNGNFNQSPDKRRHGTNPQTLAPNIHAISYLLKGKTTFSAMDYRDILEVTRPGDLVYMDPPYQGVTNSRDNRYFSGVDFNEFVDAIARLDQRQIDYLISYDGKCGCKEYGKELPSNLHCKKILLNAGISTQATLLGKRSTTLEALYISESLMTKFNKRPKARQRVLYEIGA